MSVGNSISGTERINSESEITPGVMEVFVYGEFSVPVTVQTSDSRNGRRLASSVFDHITIRLHNGKTLKIFCQNNSKDNKYIQSIRLNGKPLNQVWFRHADIVNGGTLELEMGNTPNEKLGSDPGSFPPSEMALKVSDLERPH